MERLSDIGQLKKGVEIHIIDGDAVINYEYLCVHPHNESYILAIESCSQDARKLYIKSLLDKEVYVGDYDSAFFINKEIEYYERMIKCIKKRYSYNPEVNIELI